MKIKLSQFDDNFGDFDPSESGDDRNAFEEEQVFQDSVKDHQTDVNENPLYVTVYSVERRYGGPEEGGWWYDAYYVQPEGYDGNGDSFGSVSFPVNSQEEAEIKKSELEKQYPFDKNELSSVRGRGTYVVMIEDYKGEHETKGRPHYE